MDLRKQIKYRLIDLDKSQKWLEAEITARTGLFVDSGYMHKIMSGERKAPKIVKAIREILDIPEEIRQ